MASSVNNRFRGKPRGKLCWFFVLWWKILKWLPVILVVTIMTWSYYAYAIELCMNTIDNHTERIVFLTFYHILFVMFFWSYWQAILTNVRPVPDIFKIPQGEMEKLLNAETEEQQRGILEHFARNLPVVTRTASGCIRYCNRCAQVKPDRAHHCSVCNSCVLKMDHHCPWVNNCVHFHNYKFFVLFLFYALLYCLYIAVTDFRYFVAFWHEYTGIELTLKGVKQMIDQSVLGLTTDLGFELKLKGVRQMIDRSVMGVTTDMNPSLELGVARYHVIFVFLVSMMFGFTLGSLFGYHAYLTLKNRTTLESFRAPFFTSGPDKNGFSLGAFRNFKQVFGDRARLWFLPVSSSSGEGTSYPTPGHPRASSPRTSYRSVDRADKARPADSQRSLRETKLDGISHQSSSPMTAEYGDHEEGVGLLSPGDGWSADAVYYTDSDPEI